MELTMAQIEDYAGSEELLSQAFTLVQQQAIVSLEVDDFSNPKFIMINATLKDKNHYYEVNMSMDKEDEVISAHLCSCKQHQELCRCVHCCAVLLKLYEDQQKVGQKQLKDESNNPVDRFAIDLMNQYEEQVLYTSLSLNLKEQMHLEPILEVRKKKILALTLKIGNEKKYIIKNIRDFLDDLSQNAKKGYGKGPEFIHNILSFDEESQALIQFMIRHEYDYLYFENTGALASCTQARNLCFTPDSLDEFFLLYEGKDVFQRIREKVLINTRFQRGNPRFSLSVLELENAVYELRLNSLEYRIFRGRTCIYLLHDHILYACEEAYSKAMEPLLTSFLQKQNTMVLTSDLMPNFYNNVIMNIKDHIQIEGDDISMFAPLPLQCRLYIDMPKINVITLQLIYGYGNAQYNAFSSTNMNSSRSINEEIAVRLLLMNYVNRIDALEGLAYIEHSQDALYEFLSKGIDELGDVCELYATDKFKKLKIMDSVNISMGVRMDCDLLEINFDTDDFPIEELAQVLQSYRLHKHYYRMKNGSFVNIDESALQELSAILAGIHVSDKEIKQGKVQVDKYRAMYVDNSLKNTNMIKVDRDSSFKDILRGIRNIADSDYQIPDAQKAILRNYQKVGFRWLKTMSAYGFGGILADDMGIGKTLQIITLLEEERIQHSNSTSLVVCPSSLLLNWQSEIEKFSKDLSCILICGNSEERIQQISQCEQYDIAITSYEYLKRDIDLYETHSFTYEIIDEAQYIKNHTTKNAQAVKSIHSLHRFALTGTPIENSLAELWSIFDYLMPGYLFTYRTFKNEFEIPIIKLQDPIVLKELKRLVEPFILRRIKKDVLNELPEKVEHTILIEMDEESRKLYTANLALIRKDLQKNFKEKGFENSKILVLSMLTRLRQLCCDPRLVYDNYHGIGAKVNACVEYIESCMESNKKILLFSQFTSLLSLLEKELKKKEIPYYLLKGSTPKILRQQYVNAFNVDQTPLFLISLKAGGTGLNLTGAEVVIHFDPWWNVSAQNQATDRAYRIGQHNNVQVVKLIAKDTIEEKILKLQEQKQGLSDSIIQENEGKITSMDANSIMDLFT